MKIKVCGIKDIGQLKELSALPIDLFGLIFYPASPRSVIGHLQPEEVKSLKISAKKTGVFVNEPVDSILKTVDAYGLDLVQLHGDETIVECGQVSNHVKLIKAFRIEDMQKDINKMVKPYEEVCDFYLFDKSSSGVYGGTGQKFDWSVFKNATINKPFFLSGGISSDDVAALKEFEHPYFYGVDINSRFEISPGLKDIRQVKNFVEQIRFSFQPL